MPAKGAREARPFVAEAFCLYFFHIFAIVPKNGPGSFPQYHSISFVKTNAPGGFPASRTAVLTDFLKKSPTKLRSEPFLSAVSVLAKKGGK